MYRLRPHNPDRQPLPTCQAEHNRARNATPARRRRGSTRWKRLRQQARERDHYTCRRCGRHDPTGQTLHAHHVAPISEGGTDTLDNVVTLCVTCHGQPGLATTRATVDRVPGERWL
jgi:5-methylcytosine-specific restriction endonuclease McrA